MQKAPAMDVPFDTYAQEAQLKIKCQIRFWICHVRIKIVTFDTRFHSLTTLFTLEWCY